MAVATFGQTTIEDRGYTNLESFFRQVPSVSLLDGGAQRKQVIIRGIAFDAMLNIPLVKGVLGFRAVAFSADNSGYYDNPYLGLTSQGQFDQTGGRLSLQWTPTDTFTATGTYFVDETIQDGWYRATGDDWAARNQSNRMQEVLTADAQILGLNLEWDVGWATITSATAKLDFYSYRKVDRTFLGIDDPVDGWDDARLAVLDDTWDDTLSEELRIVSAPDQFGNFDWIAGIYYSDLHNDVDVGDYIGIGDRYDQNNAGDRLVAFFGELTYNFTDDFSATIGYRDTSTTNGGGFVNQVAERRGFAFSETVDTPVYKEPHTNYMLSLVYNVSDDVMIFGRAAEGFRVGTGGANPVVQPSCREMARQVLGFTPGPVASDSMWAYEVGT